MISSMLPELIILGIDTVIVSICYLIYRHQSNQLEAVKNAPELVQTSSSTYALVDLNTGQQQQILPTAILDYVMLRGQVKSDKSSLHSHYNVSMPSGVLREIVVKEHGTVLRNHFAFDSVRTITEVLDDVPFSIQLATASSKQGLWSSIPTFKVMHALSADYLLNGLELTFTKFEPKTQGVLEVLLTSHRVRGIETTERMLLTQTDLCAFGQVNLSTMTVEPPADTLPGSFILTRLTREQLIDTLKDNKTAAKFFLLFFATAGTALAGYCVYKVSKRWLQEKHQRDALKHAREQSAAVQRAMEEARVRTQAEGADNETLAATSSTCVICLTNPREIVLLDCGHVCLCLACLERMMQQDPPARACPICRRDYRTFMHCYIP